MKKDKFQSLGYGIVKNAKLVSGPTSQIFLKNETCVLLGAELADTHF